MFFRGLVFLAVIFWGSGGLGSVAFADDATHPDDGDYEREDDETFQDGLVDLEFDPPRTLWTVQYLAPGGDYEKGVGLGVYHYPGKDKWGYFLNFQIGIHKGEPYYETLDIDSFGDPVRGRYQDPVVINVGMTRSFGQFGVFAGAGFGGSSGVARKYDPMHILADDGEYFTPDSELDTSGVNFTAGGTVDLGKLSLDLGYNTSTTSFYFGVGSTF